MDSSLLSVAEIAQRWGVSVTVVYRAVKRGDLVPEMTILQGKQKRRFFRVVDVDQCRPPKETEHES